MHNSGVLSRITTGLTLPLTVLVLVNGQPQCSTQKVTYDGKLNKLIRSTPTIPRTILSRPLTLWLFPLPRYTPPTRVQSSSQHLVGLCLHSLYTVSRYPPVLHRRLVLHTPGGSPTRPQQQEPQCPTADHTKILTALASRVVQQCPCASIPLLHPCHAQTSIKTSPFPPTQKEPTTGEGHSPRISHRSLNHPSSWPTRMVVMSSIQSPSSLTS